MKYFDTLPKVIITDTNLVSSIATDIMRRVSIIPELFNNPALYYLYDIQEGDTPEIVADKYYGDSYRYWIVLLMNQSRDPQWDWPMTVRIFEKYIENKYPGTIQTRIHHYEKIITTKDSESNEVSQQTVNLGRDVGVYNGIQTSTKTLDIPNGTQVTIDISKRAVTNYQYEAELNDSRRKIKLLNSKYVNQIENELNSLMGK